ncbi:hypothetical protein [Haloferax gibbonsii]|uniref:hypothetical protein n=1 Tax=Haloferax gibbonsii TaxID=35746 RepID=UPI00067799DF|nr:hypothetical protein [Haloferax gibbonsii]
MNASRLTRRRLLAATGTAVSVVTGGCLDVGGRTGETESEVATAPETTAEPPTVSGTERATARNAPPEYDCSAASRPEPASPTGENADALRPVAYPTRPDSFADSDRGTEYIEAYERAYRHNELVADRGSSLVAHSLSLRDARPYGAPDGAAVVRLTYTYTEVVSHSDGYVAGDSPQIIVTYYADESVVIRTPPLRSSDAPDGLVPDPWNSGRPVECFE